MLESAINLPRKRLSVAAKSAFQGAAGQPSTITTCSQANSYTNFSGPVIDIVCETLKISVNEAGIFILQNEDHCVVSISSSARDELDAGETLPQGSTVPTYGTGLLGTGKSKSAIYVCQALSPRPLINLLYLIGSHHQ